MPEIADYFSPMITGTADQVLRAAKRPAFLPPVPGLQDQNIGEVGPSGPPPAALPMPRPVSTPRTDRADLPASVQPASTSAPAQPAPPTPDVTDPRATLREVGAALSRANSPAMRVQGLQMLFEAQQPLQSEKDNTERARLSAAVDAAPADDELKARAKTMVQLGAKAEDIAKALGFNTPMEKVGQAQQAVDKAFAPEYAKFKTGGAATVERNIQQLQDARTMLLDNQHAIGATGPIGYLPDSVAALFPAGERAITVREAVEGVVQNNLREILGAQFTQKEGENLVNRAFNPKLSPQENAIRLDRLFKQMQTAYADKAAASEYFGQNDTLQGFKGRPFMSASDFTKALDTPDPSAGGAAGAGQPRKFTKQEYQAAKSGTPFIDPEGNLRYKP